MRPTLATKIVITLAIGVLFMGSTVHGNNHSPIYVTETLLEGDHVVFHRCLGETTEQSPLVLKDCTLYTPPIPASKLDFLPTLRKVAIFVVGSLVTVLVEAVVFPSTIAGWVVLGFVSRATLVGASLLTETLNPLYQMDKAYVAEQIDIDNLSINRPLVFAFKNEKDLNDFFHKAFDLLDLEPQENEEITENTDGADFVMP